MIPRTTQQIFDARLFSTQRNGSKSCHIACSPSDFYPGDKCDKNGCYPAPKVRNTKELQNSVLKHLAKDATDTYNYYRDRESKKKPTDASVMLFYSVTIKAMDDLYQLVFKVV